MKTKILHLFVLLNLLIGLLAATPATPARAAKTTKGISPEILLNPDGSLNTHMGVSGAIDLSGWDIQLDIQRGPVLAPIADLDQWAALSAGGGAFKASISTVAVNGSDIYVGGSFQDAGGNPEADYIAKWNGSAWVPLGNGGAGQPALTASVSDMLFVGSDLYVTGNFDALNPDGSVIPNSSYLAKWNGSVWSAVPGLSTNLNDWGNTLEYDTASNSLYIGGRYTDVNGIPEADRIAKVALGTGVWSALGGNGAGSGSLGGMVTSIALNTSGQVFVGGFFTDVNNGGAVIPEADYIGKWDGVNWSALGNNGSGNGALNLAVGAIEIDGSNNVYVGGNFYNAAGVNAADYIAKWDGSVWSALGNDGVGEGALLSTGGGTAIQRIILTGSDIYVSGYFIGASVLTADYVAKFDTTNSTWSGLGGNGSGNGALNYSVAGMAYSGGKLYIGGYFGNVNDNGTVLPAADYFAVWNGTHWSTLGASNGDFNSSVNAIAKVGTDVYVGGTFRDLGGDPRIDYLARWDGSQWNPVGNLNQNYGALSSTVYALATDGTNLYVGGAFTSAYNNGVWLPTADYVARWDGTTWYAMQTNGAGQGSLNGTVYALAVSGSNIYAGGNFTNVNNNGTIIAEADYLAVFNGTDWASVGNGGAGVGSLNGQVNTLLLDGSNLYVGGAFTNVNNAGAAIAEADYIAKWDGANWSALGNTAALSNTVYALTKNGNDLYAGGIFSVNGIPGASRIAKFDTQSTTWSAVGGTNVFNGSVNSLVWYGGNLYAGGVFSNAAGIPEADYVAKFDGTNWSALGHNGGSNGSLNRVVSVLAVVDQDLFVGGDFTDANNQGSIIPEADFLAAYGLASIPPSVQSIVRTDPNPTNAASVTFTVTFSEDVSGVTLDDFTLAASGIGDASISTLNGSGAIYTVTVSTGTTNGTLRLDLTDNDSILDLTAMPLGGAGTGNGNFVTGETYNVYKTTTFADVPLNHWAWKYIESIYNAGITGGCGNGNYCPTVTVTRDQMAVFLLRGIHGSAYTPPAATGAVFADVPADFWAAAWIEQLAAEGITGGCSDGNYCPSTPVTRDQMAVFLLRAEHGSAYTPPTAAGAVFGDIPSNFWAAAWVEQLAAEGITGGCGGGNYCPTTPVSRDQMAVFLQRTFNLILP
ncbi:MAG: S-layer homology domain-containing protein [Chloroflexi bacterium]|nr:S-layer homology domain-containing protein [Chloroflexota bacterium]